MRLTSKEDGESEYQINLQNMCQSGWTADYQDIDSSASEKGDESADSALVFLFP